MEETLKAFAAEGLKISLIHFTESYMASERWHLDLSMEEGVRLQLSTTATTLEEVVERARSKWVALRDRGVYAAMALTPPPASVALEPPSHEVSDMGDFDTLTPGEIS